MTTTYTPERQMFPPGTKVKAVGNQDGKTYTGIVARPSDSFENGTYLSARSDAVTTGLCAFWNNGEGTPINPYVETMLYHMATISKLEDAPLINLHPTQETQEETAPMQSIKSAAATVRDYVKPYEKYLVAAAILLALDHFVLKGAMTDRIQRLAQSLADRLASMVDGLIARIGGE